MNIHKVDYLGLVLDSIRGHSNEPGKGVIVVVRSTSQDAIRKFALGVGERYPSGHVPVYMVNGSIRGEYAWPFSRIRKYPRLRLDTRGDFAEGRGIIFPEDRPIVLLAEDFDCFDDRNQVACHLADGEGYSSGYSLHKGSVLLCGVSGKRQINLSVANRAFHVDLDKEIDPAKSDKV